MMRARAHHRTPLCLTPPPASSFPPDIGTLFFMTDLLGASSSTSSPRPASMCRLLHTAARGLCTPP
ncbi:MAG: hypothetical protein EOO41_05070 [Methanobacteriota archaeon]|nr:MAG: hypothetical protein EOO41_05070 [Euryarchaeota archaeon]